MRLVGSEFKLNIHVDPIDGDSMDKYEFECHFYVRPDRTVIIKKDDMIREDENNYIALIDSEKSKMLGRGIVKLKFIAHIIDTDFFDGIRTEIVDVPTKVTLM